jgi:hypothetical protein
MRAAAHAAAAAAATAALFAITDEPMSLNGGPSPPDFNVYMDPLAAAVLLHAAAVAGVPLVLLHWTLTSLGTTKGQNIMINSSTIRLGFSMPARNLLTLWRMCVAYITWHVCGIHHLALESDLPTCTSCIKTTMHVKLQHCNAYNIFKAALA